VPRRSKPSESTLFRSLVFFGTSLPLLTFLIATIAAPIDAEGMWTGPTSPKMRSEITKNQGTEGNFPIENPVCWPEIFGILRIWDVAGAVLGTVRTPLLPFTPQFAYLSFITCCSSLSSCFMDKISRYREVLNTSRSIEVSKLAASCIHVIISSCTFAWLKARF
jgi:hypothetical protein